MRLSADQITQIRQAVFEFAGGDAVVRLFGSRADDGGAGGDVDLLVECPAPVDTQTLLAETDHRFGFLAAPTSPQSGNTTTVGGNQ